AARGAGAISQPAMEVDATHQLHREIGDTARADGELVDRHDVWVLELARDLRLTDEPAFVEGLPREVLVQPLERDVAQQVSIRGRMDPAHPTAAELRKDTQVSWRRDPFCLGLVLGDPMVTPGGYPLDDVNGLRLVLFP